LHNNSRVNIIINPKILTEDNFPAEIFVGETDRFKTQSVSNDQGNIITNNFSFIDVGARLRVTPQIGNNDVVTLTIEQDITNSAAGTGIPVITSGNAVNVDINLVPVLTKTTTVTRVHVPNKFFLILSGQIFDDNRRARNQVPCLGGIPILGAGFSRRLNSDNKRNLMTFIRPIIVDTEEEMTDLTRREQHIFQEKSKFRRRWNYEIEEALDLFNIKHTDPDERCSIYKDVDCTELCPCEG
jgi:type III secretion protein C